MHCAAQTSVARSMADPEADWATNVAGTHQVARLARGWVSAFRFLLLWRRTVRRNGAGGRRFSDAGPASYYGLNKYAGEQLVRLEAPSWAILRPSNIYGPGQRTDLEGGVVSIFLERLQAGATVDIYGDGLQRRDFVYIDDVVDAVELALKGTENVTWNVSSGRSTSVLDLGETLRAVTGLDASIRCQPARAGDVRTSHLSPGRLLATGGSGAAG